MDRLAEALQGFEGGAGGQDGPAGPEAGGRWAGVEYVRIDGSHDSAHRREAVLRFRCAKKGGEGEGTSLARPRVRCASCTARAEPGSSPALLPLRFRPSDDPRVRVALLSITAAAVGLDFSSASAVVFVELPNEVGPPAWRRLQEQRRERV